ncbi:ubiquitin-like protein ATG12 [Mizuhopecten yessoensis]|uniref:Ubiquitin-like protein ATG12 n=1 Tax=Mizuhopecten yessoensis TaxID=6573 RepID=A0A210QCJ8_MIZYE|nr:ubiquitin-like protein ATG12 [Mizuhopecten yessoensis]OWF46477.1 Ubiquitin-like protein ATG12 [Mizuhopecten yessoensis]
MSTDDTELKETTNLEPTDEASADKKPTENDEELENKEQQPQAGASNTAIEAKSKIDVLLKPAGDAPIMKKKRWAVERNKRVSWISEFIKKYLKLDQKESMFLYVQQSFAPSPDTEIGTVFDCFGSDGKLVVHYCRTQAWG